MLFESYEEKDIIFIKDKIKYKINKDKLSIVADNSYISYNGQITLPESIDINTIKELKTLHDAKKILIITDIGDGAFLGCKNLTIIVLPTKLESIGKRSFEGCTSLISITIPSSVTSIGNSAFYECTSLTNLVLLDNLTSIGDSAFSNCTNLLIEKIPV